MKIFTMRNILGLAAIGGVYAYARSRGGFKPAFDELMAKKNDVLDRVKSRAADASDDVSELVADLRNGNSESPRA